MTSSQNIMKKKGSDRCTGYMVRDLLTWFYEWGCYDSNFDHVWDLDDVADFLKGEYKARGLAW